jgi:hypothetical protein
MLWEAGIMNLQRFSTVAPALCRTAALAGLAGVCLAALGSSGIDNTGATPVMDASAVSADVAQATRTSRAAVDDGTVSKAIVDKADVSKADVNKADVSKADIVTAVESVTATAADAAPASNGSTPDKQEPVVESATAVAPEVSVPPEVDVPPDVNASPEVTPSVTRPVQVATAGPPDQVFSDVKPAASSIEVLDECWNVDVCVDRYLWALYQRAPKEDSIKEYDKVKVTVKKKKKWITVTRTITRLVDEDFTWKDPKAAEKVGMSVQDYVVGGMDRGFKLKLFHALHAAEEAGLSPGITSAFRDDYRQSIASGLKAANNRSYHGGSLRGGYGHGLAADVVSVNGTTRAQRWIATENLWKWIDAHGKEFGIGRPYLDHDPPHLAPTDGKEYADHNGGTRARHAEATSKKHKKVAVRDDRATSKRLRTASRRS